MASNVASVEGARTLKDKAGGVRKEPSRKQLTQSDNVICAIRVALVAWTPTPSFDKHDTFQIRRPIKIKGHTLYFAVLSNIIKIYLITSFTFKTFVQNPKITPIHSIN